MGEWENWESPKTAGSSGWIHWSTESIDLTDNSKYPPEVIAKSEEAKEPLRPWTIKSLRKAICHYVTVQENVHFYVSSVNTNVKGQHVVPRQLRPLTSDSHRPSAEVFSTNS